MVVNRRWAARVGATVIAGAVLAAALAAPVAAQSSSPTQYVPLKVTIVIARYDGDTRKSNLPYVLHVNANEGEGTSLRTGAMVPIQSVSSNGQITYQYQNVGTQIDLSATSVGDDRFRLRVTLEDSSVAEDDDSPRPVIKSFTSRNGILLTDGQSIEYTAASDPATGETVRLTISMEVAG